MIIINELTVSDVEKSIKFYTTYFGFRAELTEGEPLSWAQLDRGGAILMLQDYGEAKKEIIGMPKKTNSSNLIRFEFDNAGDTKEIYVSLKRDGIRIFIDYAKTDYGKIEFGAYDPDGNMIIVSAPSN